MRTIDSSTTGLAAFDSARDGFVQAMESVPPESLGYLRPGDDYSLGGLVVHVNYVLEHYLGVLEAIVASGFGECRPEDPPGLQEAQNRRARTSLSPAEVAAELEKMRTLHERVTQALAQVLDSSRAAPVWYPEGQEPFPTSADDVLGWLIDHYHEHMPHAGALAEAWRRDAETARSLAVVEAFNQAFAAGDVAGVMALMTEDCVFENTLPAPDGERHEGQAAVRGYWESFFATSVNPRFETEEVFAAGDRVVARWRYSWGAGDSAGHVRGVDVLRVHADKVAEKLSYVKG